jgi:ABC-transporter N-terminal
VCGLIKEDCRNPTSPCGSVFDFSDSSDLLLFDMATTGSGVYAPAFGAGGGQGIVRTLTGQSYKSNHQEDREKDDNDPDEDHPISKAGDWAMMPDVKHFQNQNNKSHFKGRRLSVTWKNLNVKGVGADAAFQENVFSQFNIPQKIGESRRGLPTKTILEDCHGCVKPVSCPHAVWSALVSQMVQSRARESRNKALNGSEATTQIMIF